jgi:hypothetical protein
MLPGLNFFRTKRFFVSFDPFLQINAETEVHNSSFIMVLAVHATQDAIESVLNIMY